MTECKSLKNEYIYSCKSACQMKGLVRYTLWRWRSAWAATTRSQTDSGHVPRVRPRDLAGSFNSGAHFLLATIVWCAHSLVTMAFDTAKAGK